jgi:hypothetical protein
VSDPAGPTARSPRVGRTAAVAVLVVLGGALLATSAAPWLLVPVSTAIAEATVSVPGSAAVPAVPASALVVLAGGLAVAIAGRVARVVAAVVVAGAGLLAAVAAVRFVADPAAAALAASAEATGLRELAGAPSVTPWPVVTAGLGGLAALAAVTVALGSRRWASGAGGRRFERAAPDGGASSGETARAGSAGTEAEPADVRTRAMDDWDALSRGEDPT